MDRRRFLQTGAAGLAFSASGVPRAPAGQADGPSQAAGGPTTDLTARFVYEGAPPPRIPIDITVDCDYCGKHSLFREELVVDPNNRGVANILAWLYVGRGKPGPPVNESFVKTERAEVRLDSTYCRIDPHVQLLRTTQTLLVRNTDPIGDGIKIDALSNPPVNMLFAPGGETRLRFPNVERLPVHVACPIHPWESGWLLVIDHPYMAASDEDGRITLRNLPVGEWTFQFWHEKSRYISEVKRNGEMTTWRRGRLEIEIKPGRNDLGEIKLSPSLFG